jgi:nucleoside-diphosphate-sugar epimerase
VHGASIASPTFYRKYPVETLDANIWGLRHILDLYRGRDTLKGLLFFSSSEIYGDPDPSAIPTPETYRGNVSCHGPRACYDESKRFGETMAWVYAQQFGMPITVARPFNNYGPGMRLGDKRLPADFALAVTEGRDLVILSDGTPTRTFCYVADAVAGYLLCLLHGSYDYFNIGIDKPEIMVRELAEIYRKAAGGGLRLRRPGPLRGKRGSRLSGGQPQPPLPGDRQGARRAGLRAHDPRGGRREAVSRVPQGRDGGGRMKLAVVGTGYVGLVSGVCLAAKGHDVTCVDLNPAIVERLNRAEPTIHERGLPELLAEVHGAGNFRATTEIARGARRGGDRAPRGGHTVGERRDRPEIHPGRRARNRLCSARQGRLSVGHREIDGRPRHHRHGRAQEIEDASGKTLGQGFGLGMNPEFLREGEAIEDFMEPDRIVLGHEDAHDARRVLRTLYAPWDVDKPEVNTRTAEMIKYANNCLLATQISAVNEIANLAAAVGGIDAMDVMAGVHLDKRWNPILGQGRAGPTPRS